MRAAATVSRVIESRGQAGSGLQRPGPRAEPGGLALGLGLGRGCEEDPAPAYPLDALHSLTATIETTCEDLFAAAPFAGHQATGCSIDAFVDEVVAALRSLQSEADDLRRAMAIAQQRTAARGEAGGA